MNSNPFRAVWIVVLCCAACSFWHAANGADAKMAPSKNLSTAEPPGLALAVKAALDWWQQRAVAFPEFKESPPGDKWMKFEEHRLREPQETTYVVLAKDEGENWFATTSSDRPKQWEIRMPTRADCTVIYSVFADPTSGKTRVWEVRFSYRTVSL